MLPERGTTGPRGKLLGPRRRSVIPVRSPDAAEGKARSLSSHKTRCSARSCENKSIAVDGEMEERRDKWKGRNILIYEYKKTREPTLAGGEAIKDEIHNLLSNVFLLEKSFLVLFE